jgi:hypothetical protein
MASDPDGRAGSDAETRAAWAQSSPARGSVGAQRHGALALVERAGASSRSLLRSTAAGGRSSRGQSPQASYSRSPLARCYRSAPCASSRSRTARLRDADPADAPRDAGGDAAASGYQGLTTAERTEALALGQRVAEVATWVRAGQQQAAARAQQQRQAASQHYDPSA